LYVIMSNLHGRSKANARDFEDRAKRSPNPLKTLGGAGKMPVEQARRRARSAESVRRAR
jgi:hypothetical protein